MVTLLIGGVNGFSQANKGKQTTKSLITTPATIRYGQCPDNVIIVNVDRLKGQNRFDSWLHDNNDYNRDLVCFLNTTPSSCAKETLYVNLLNFDNLSLQYQWLTENAEIICYDETSPYLERARIVKKKYSTVDDQIDRDKDEYKKYTFRDISSTPNFNTSPKTFNSYLKIYEDAPPSTNPQDGTLIEGTYRFEVVTQYDTTGDATCYSLPFIMSVLNENHIKDETKLVFRFVPIFIDGKKSIGFCLEYDGIDLSSKYYDYSTRPGLGLAK